MPPSHHHIRLFCVLLITVLFAVVLGIPTLSAEKTSPASKEQLVKLDGFKTAVTAVTFAGDGKHAICGCKDGMVCIRDLESGKLKSTFEGPDSEINCLVGTADGMKLIAGCKDGAIWVWDTKEAKQLQKLSGHRDAILALAVSKDGKKLFSAAGGVDHGMKLWDLEKLKELGQTPFTKKGIVYAAAFSPDDRWTITGHATEVRVWDTVSGKEIAKLDGHTSRVLCTTVSKDEKMAASGSKDKSIRVWDLATRKERRLLEGHKDAVISVAFTPDGRKLASSSADGTAKLWDIGTGKCLATLNGHGEDVPAITVSADGQRVLTGGMDKTARLWRMPK